MKSWKYYRDLAIAHPPYRRKRDSCTTKRNKKAAKKFHRKHGFYQEDTWELGHAMAVWLLPRIAYLRDHHVGTPGLYFIMNKDTGEMENEDEGHKQYTKDLNTITKAMALIVEDKVTYTKKEKETIDEGLQLLAKLWLILWD